METWLKSRVCAGAGSWDFELVNGNWRLGIAWEAQRCLQPRGSGRRESRGWGDHGMDSRELTGNRAAWGRGKGPGCRNTEKREKI